MATRKFQKGDLVRCVKESDVGYFGPLGALTTVAEDQYVGGSGQPHIRVDTGSLYSSSCLAERFELVRPVGGFQIGDRIALGGWPLLVAKAEHIALAERNLQTVKFIERPEHHGFKVGDRVNLQISPREAFWAAVRESYTPSDALLRDKAYKAWLEEERDGRLRSAFEAGWKARGGK